MSEGGLEYIALAMVAGGTAVIVLGLLALGRWVVRQPPARRGRILRALATDVVAIVALGALGIAIGPDWAPLLTPAWLAIVVITLARASR